LTTVVGLALAVVAGCGGGPKVTAPPSTATVTARSDLVYVTGNDVTVPHAKPLPAMARLGGPDFALQLREAGTASELGRDILQYLGRQPNLTGVSPSAAAPVTAGPGREFLLVRFTGIDARGATSPFPGSLDGRSRLRVGDATRELPAVGGPAGVIVVLVPTGAPVTLVVTNHERDQSIDLRTGQPGPEAVAAYTGRLPSGSAKFSLTGQFAGEPTAAEFDVKVSAVVQPWDGTWAAAGHAWLGITVHLMTYTVRPLGGKVDLTRSLQLKVDGRTVTGKPTSDAEFKLPQGVDLGAYEAEGGVAVDVPASGVRKVALQFTSLGALTLGGNPTTFRVATNGSATIELT
jgi:hypothetical protein